MIVHAHETPPRCLSDSEPGDLLQVRLIVFELVRSRCWDLPLREGDMLRYVRDTEDGVTVSRLDGSRMTVPHECARFIGVELVSAEVRDGSASAVSAGEGAGAPRTRWSARRREGPPAEVGE